MGLPFLGSIPLHAEVRLGGDTGAPGRGGAARQPVRAELRHIAGALAQRVSIQTLAAWRRPRETRVRRPRRDDAARARGARGHAAVPRGARSATPRACTRAARRRARPSRRRALEVARLVGRAARGDRVRRQRLGGEQPRAPGRRSPRCPGAGRRRIVTTAIEHPSVLETARFLESRGFGAHRAARAGERHRGPRRACARRSAPDVALVSVMAVNNETGAIQPLDDIGPLVAARGRALPRGRRAGRGQAPGRRWTPGTADLLSLAAHKLHGPLGAAALFVRRRVKLVPLVHGGQPGARAGAPAPRTSPAIAGLGAAAARARACARRGRAAPGRGAGRAAAGRAALACRTRASTATSTSASAASSTCASRAWTARRCCTSSTAPGVDGLDRLGLQLGRARPEPRADRDGPAPRGRARQRALLAGRVDTTEDDIDYICRGHAAHRRAPARARRGGGGAERLRRSKGELP